jgi:threonine/homoserine/homoserine lactone efflux protein
MADSVAATDRTLLPHGPLLTSSVHWAALAPLLVTALAVMGSPGPATISLTASGAAFGVRRSVRYLAGVVAGTAVVLVAVAAGVTGALLATPALRPALIAAAVAYIVYLGYHIATAPPLGAGPEAAAAPSATGGLLLGIANPKAWVAIGAVFVSVRLAQSAVLDAGLKTGVLAVMIVVINSVWLAAGASLAPVLRDPVRARRANILLATALLVSTAAALVH